MDRRSFLKAAALTGLAITAPVISRDAGAAAPYGGPYYIMVNAGGGWDPNFMFNPTLNKTHNRLYTEIKKIGNIPYAPIPLDLTAMGLDTTTGYDQYLMDNEAFLNKHGAELCVLNGVDTSTNNHDAGNRTMWCGRISEGYPALGALIAGVRAPEKPMAFISSGGYDATQNVVPLTRVSSVATLKKIAFPNVVDPNNLTGPKYHTDETFTRIAKAQADRVSALKGGQRLPTIQRSMDGLFLARVAENELQNLQIPASMVDLPGNQLGDLERMLQQAQLAIAAFKSGLAVAANVSIGGFDTHGSHDTNQRRQLAKLLYGLSFIMGEVAANGLGGKVVVLSASDFGRGPHYNGTAATSGKDHWPITSFLAMGAGIAGNRVVGGTTEDAQKPKNVDPATLNVVEGSAGVRLRPEHIHRALRVKAQVAGTELDKQFLLPGEDLPLFG